MAKEVNRRRKVATGLWQLNTQWWIRVQRVHPLTGRKVNLKRRLSNLSEEQALAKHDELEQELTRQLELELAQAMVEPRPQVTPVMSHAGFSPRQSLPISAGLPTNGTSLGTVGDFAELWLRRKVARGDLTESTKGRYEECFDRLSPRIMHTPIEMVSPEIIERWMLEGRKMYAASTVNGWWRVLRALYNDRSVKRRLGYNPVEMVDPLPETPDLDARKPLTPKQLMALLHALEKQDYVICEAANVQAFSGLRWGEVSALRWEDWDEDAGVIHVCRAVSAGEIAPTPKSKKGRLFGVPPVIADRLRRFRDRLKAEQHPGLESGLMFPSSKGKPLWSSRISNALKEARKEAKIAQRFTSHGFRRSMSDLLRQAQVDPVVAAAIIGHDTERMRRHYSTVSAREAANAAARVWHLVEVGSKDSEGTP